MFISELFHTINPKEVKIHLAIKPNNGENPLHVFWNGRFKEWQEWQNQKNFERPYIFSLIHFSGTNWLFAGVYEQLGREKVDNHYEYKTVLSPINRSLVGRLLVEFPKSFRATYLKGENYLEQMKISEIFKFPSSFQHFPGYDRVKILFKELEPIIQWGEATWKTALENMKGIYLITDLLNGNQYVGSAYGDKAFWNRWSEYMANGHGGNKLLKRVIKESGFDYAINNYQMSILEVMNSNSAKEDVIQRENFWKEVLGTRAFGLNSN
ncbi:MAG TPA: GIY-YIG nuclease family protein [Flavobacteriaceae bacterium]